MRTPRTRVGGVLAALATCLGMAAAPAHAAPDATVGPGHALRYVSAHGSSTCTLGFTFRANAHTYGVTAGHCVAAGPGYAQDLASGYRGRVVSYDYDPSRIGNDFALIDFGNTPVASTLLDAPIMAAAAPTADHAICHTGTASGTSCGELSSRYGTQYLATGLADTPGDSGGPVWTRAGIDGVAIIGIWLGSHTDNNGSTYGRFYPIKEALTGLGLRTAAEQM
ncbi:hypothetical protein [Mycobacteroides abscessus]|nr:hypothetical protein [Mycobacteroides abscessus]SKU68481.1 Streptogrisin-B precursor [Mycobacteroides abscessus subsp. massiliense]